MTANSPEYQKHYHKIWYEKNREKRLIQIRKKKEEYTNNLDALKMQSCVDCGFIPVHHSQMDWDHVGPKKDNISTLRFRGASKQIREELKNCELVCANCHRLRTHLRPRNGPVFETDGA